MNRPFAPLSKLSRAASALAAVLSTVVVLSSIAGLAEHYGSQAQVATNESTSSRA